ncbi:hypothetical protein BGZ91_000974 [Linnemannia elongata]|nr:hypothetical protein BGZ91_000974 [Linnemannia elongata]
MLYSIPLQDNIVQGFRGVHKSYKPSTLTHIDPDDIIHINCYADPESHIDFILWDEIKQVFEEALFVKCGSNLHPYLKGADFRPLEPKRIAAVPGVVLDVVVGGELVALTKVAYPNKQTTGTPRFLHIDYTLKVPMPDEPPAAFQGSQSSQNGERGSSTHKVEVQVSSPELETPPPLADITIKTPNPRGPHGAMKERLTILKRRPKDPQDHAASVMETKDLNEQTFQPLSRFLF